MKEAVGKYREKYGLDKKYIILGGTMNADVKITVLKRTKNRPFLEEYAETVWDICERFGDRDCFVSKNCNMPDGFCSWAWADIQSYVMTLARGGNFIGVREGTYVSCCTDGFRPVFFLIERI